MVRGLEFERSTCHVTITHCKLNGVSFKDTNLE
jgi:hypothetical protein